MIKEFVGEWAFAVARNEAWYMWEDPWESLRFTINDRASRLYKFEGSHFGGWRVPPLRHFVVPRDFKALLSVRWPVLRLCSIVLARYDSRWKSWIYSRGTKFLEGRRSPSWQSRVGSDRSGAEEIPRRGLISSLQQIIYIQSLRNGCNITITFSQDDNIYARAWSLILKCTLSICIHAPRVSGNGNNVEEENRVFWRVNKFHFSSAILFHICQYYIVLLSFYEMFCNVYSRYIMWRWLPFVSKGLHCQWAIRMPSSAAFRDRFAVIRQQVHGN